MSERDRKTIVVGGVFLAALLILWFLIIPAWQSWNDTREHIRRSQAQMEAFQDRARRLISADRELEPVLGAAVKSPLRSIASARRQLVRSVSDLYSQSGAEIQSVQPQAERPVAELPGVTRLTVQVQCSCQPMTLVRLLADAKNAKSLLVLDQVDMNSGGRNGGGQLAVTMVWSTMAAQNGTDSD